MKNEKQVTMKNGRRAISGTCSVCGTKMFRIGGGGGSSASVAVAKQRPKVKAASRKPTSKAAKTRKSKTKGKR
jgi:hypothetical protein